MQPGTWSIATQNMEEPHKCNIEQNNPEIQVVPYEWINLYKAYKMNKTNPIY